jgi:polyhydroxybutyrate depolymerase
MKKGAGGDIYGHEQVLQKWAAADSCLATPVMTHLPVINEDGTSVIREEFQNPNGLEVIGYTIVGGGHTWPEGSQYLPKAMIGTVSHNLDACEIIWDFFRHYRHTFVEYPYK